MSSELKRNTHVANGGHLSSATTRDRVCYQYRMGMYIIKTARTQTLTRARCPLDAADARAIGRRKAETDRERTCGTGDGRVGTAHTKRPAGTQHALRCRRVRIRASRTSHNARGLIRRCQHARRTRRAGGRGVHAQRRVEPARRTRHARRQASDGAVATSRTRHTHRQA
jgi:hypothetical protein